MDRRGRSEHQKGAPINTRQINARITAIAGGQEGNVSRQQLLDAGVTRRMISSRLRSGFLVQIYRGVYSVGPRRRYRRARWWAAVLAGGPGAVLSHRSAAALWGIRKGDPGVIDVTVPSGRRRIPGIRFHVERLPADEVTGEMGVPTTTAIRTAFDCAAVLQPAQTESAVNEIEVGQLWSALSLEDLLARHPRRRGAPVLRGIVKAGRIGMTVTDEGLHEEFIAFVDHYELPRPVTSTFIEGVAGDHEADCVWREKRVNVELDGRPAHMTAAAFDGDRKRDLSVEALGWTVIRVSSDTLRHQPDLLLGRFRLALAIPAAGAPLTASG